MSDPTIPESVRRISGERAIEFDRRSRIPQPEKIEPGQIWSTHRRITLSDEVSFETNEPRIVVILEGKSLPDETIDQVVAAPISIFVSMASEFDLVCGQGAAQLAFEFIVEVWNESPVLKKHLRQHLGKLSDEATTQLLNLYRYHLTDEQVPASMLKWVGPRLMGEEDPRFAFQENEVEAVTYLGRAAAAALSLRVAEGEAIPARESQFEKRHFTVQPMLRRLTDVLRQPTIAYAAGPGEQKAWVVTMSEEQEYFTFELLNNHQPPYEVYLVAHEISPSLVGRQCVITIKTAELEFQSDPTELKTGSEIRVGEVHRFKPDQAQSIEISIQ